MTLSTSDIKPSAKTTAVYAGTAAFALAVAALYERFSYGEYSWFMRGMFLIPLLGGVFPSSWFTRKKTEIRGWAFRFWNSGLAVLLCGCLVRGIITISGRTSSYDWYYGICGFFFLILGAGIQLISRI